jgi:hypothetical protein
MQRGIGPIGSMPSAGYNGDLRKGVAELQIKAANKAIGSAADPLHKFPYTGRNTNSYDWEQSYWFDSAATTVTRNPGSVFTTTGVIDACSKSYCHHPRTSGRGWENAVRRWGLTKRGAGWAAGQGYGHVQRATNDGAGRASSLFPA